MIARIRNNESDEGSPATAAFTSVKDRTQRKEYGEEEEFRNERLPKIDGGAPNDP